MNHRLGDRPPMGGPQRMLVQRRRVGRAADAGGCGGALSRPIGIGRCIGETRDGTTASGRRRMPGLQADDHDLSFAEAGSGAPLALIHCTPGDQHSFAARVDPPGQRVWGAY